MNKYSFSSFFKVILTFCLFSVMSQLALAKDRFQPAVLYDMATKHDKSFNEGVYNGLKRYKEDTGVNFWEFQITNETQSEQFLRQMAKKGADIIIVVGFAQIQALKTVSAEFPDTKFTLIDATLDMPNVQSVAFREHEGAYLAGALAAMKSGSSKVGFIGGMDIPLIRKFSCGFEQGAKAVSKDSEVYVNMVGDTPLAWKDPTKAREIALGQISQGVDVIYTAAGTSAIGVLGAVADSENAFAIGADSNQNYIYPGKILTSVVKKVDIAAYEALRTVHNGTWEPGMKVLGLKEGGIDWVLDEYNKPLLSEDIVDRLNRIKADIISEKVKVVDYTTTNSCKY